MIRSAASKVMWVGRATVFLVGLAVILAVVLGVATTALGATGGNFILGKANNTASTPTGLVSTLADAAKSALIVQNKSGGPALDLRVGNTSVPANDVAPMKVNSQKVVTNLNADKLDGKSDTDFYAAGSKVNDSAHADQADNATNAGNADTVDGKHAADFYASGSKVADSDKLDNLDSRAFGIATADNAVKSAECDFINSHNQCAPVQVVVPPGKQYIVSVLSIGTWKGGGLFDSQVRFCSSYRYDWASAGNCEGATGIANVFNTLTLEPGKFASGTAEGEVTLTAGTYIFYTRVENTAPTQDDIDARVITKVLVRDASAPQPTGVSRL
jgi:hypothetical protein